LSRLRGPLLVVLVVMAAVTGCCDRETRRVPAHWMYALNHHVLIPVSVESTVPTGSRPRPIFAAKSTLGHEFTADPLSGFVVAQRYGFWFDIRNTGGSAVSLLWSDAAYVDEHGVRHNVYAYHIGDRPPVDLANGLKREVYEPGVARKVVVAPQGKTYTAVEGCDSYYTFEEPLLPYEFGKMTEGEVTSYLQRMESSGTPVTVEIPLVRESVNGVLIFKFALRSQVK
jgi:hypothetical protein